MPNEPTVYIVDDDADMRDSLQWLLQAVGLRVRAFSSADEFLRVAEPERPGCLVSDVRMPGASGLELLEALARRGDPMPAILITAFADVPMAVRAMKAGAVEFLEKPFHRQTLIERVQNALRSDSQGLRVRAERERIEGLFRRLTDKEREVLDCLFEGLPNKAIAARLQVTSRAIEMRRSSLMKKLGVDSLAELLYLAMVHRKPQAPSASDAYGLGSRA
jgi:FixJ family two-component response regulator